MASSTHSRIVPAFRAVQMNQPILHRQVPELAADFDLVLIDAGGRDNATFRSALVAADQIVIPIAPSAYDVWASAEVFRLLEELSMARPNLFSAVLFNQIIPRTVVAREAIKAVGEYQMPVLETRLHARVAWKQAAGEGLSVTEWQPKGAAAAELRKLSHELGIKQEMYHEAQATA